MFLLLLQVHHLFLYSSFFDPPPPPLPSFATRLPPQQSTGTPPPPPREAPLCLATAMRSRCLQENLRVLFAAQAAATAMQCNAMRCDALRRAGHPPRTALLATWLLPAARTATAATSTTRCATSVPPGSSATTAQMRAATPRALHARLLPLCEASSATTWCYAGRRSCAALCACCAVAAAAVSRCLARSPPQINNPASNRPRFAAALMRALRKCCRRRAAECAG